MEAPQPVCGRRTKTSGMAPTATGTMMLLRRPSCHRADARRPTPLRPPRREGNRAPSAPRRWPKGRRTRCRGQTPRPGQWQYPGSAAAEGVRITDVCPRPLSASRPRVRRILPTTSSWASAACETNLNAPGTRRVGDDLRPVNCADLVTGTGGPSNQNCWHAPRRGGTALRRHAPLAGYSISSDACDTLTPGGPRAKRSRQRGAAIAVAEQRDEQ